MPEIEFVRRCSMTRVKLLVLIALAIITFWLGANPGCGFTHLEKNKLEISAKMEINSDRMFIFLDSGGTMIKKVNGPTVVEATGNKKKFIEEYFGLLNSKEQRVSIARMKSPAGWIEPGQTPEFDEYTVVLKGVLQVETKQGVDDIHAGEAIRVSGGVWVRYSTPGQEGAEYISICLPAFSPAMVHRDE
jgi:mannose-6-phosphate isomerase-like protein (cupin superfamily)